MFAFAFELTIFCFRDVTDDEFYVSSTAILKDNVGLLEVTGSEGSLPFICIVDDGKSL